MSIFAQCLGLLRQIASIRPVMGVVLGGVALGGASAVTVTFDFRHDTGNFFGAGTLARDVLDQAGADISALLTDTDLEAILPGGGNSWIASYTNPSGGPPTPQTNLDIQHGEILIFVGARDLQGGLGSASLGTYAIPSGDPEWTATVTNRGQEGAEEFGPWGGSLTVSNTVAWDYSTTGTNGKDYNLYSNIVHEIGHLLGVGTASSWYGQLNDAETEFLGTVAVATYGGLNVPLSDNGHWQDGLMSEIYGTSTTSGTAYDPTLAKGEFKPLTNLDVAALQDIGWDIAAIPEPSTCVLLLGGALMAARRRR